jgi:hypothetical protein
MNQIERTYEVVAQLAGCINQAATTLRFDYEIPIAIIGAQAMAAHNYVRATQDVDLGVWIDEEAALFREVERTFQHPAVKEITRTASEPGDPLGVWHLTGDEIIEIEVVNFYAPHNHRSPGSWPLRLSTRIDELGVNVVDLPALILLKLYAGSTSDAADIIELLKCNPELNVAELREIAGRFGQLEPLDALLAHVGMG